MPAPASFKNLGGEWMLTAPEPLTPGQMAEVFVKASQTIKHVKVGEYVAASGRNSYLYRIAKDDTKPAPDREERLGDVSKVFDLIDKGKGRFPALLLHVPGMPNTVRLSLAGAASKYPGALQVKEAFGTDTIEGEPGNRHWYGRLLRDGTFVKAREFRTQSSLVAMQLRRLAANPVQVAREFGKMTDRCMFCALKLTDPRSVATGYGETCAGNRGLPWPVEDTP